MKLSEQLEAAFALIDSEDKWCQGDFAKTKEGTSVLASSRNACKFCTVGAILKSAEGWNGRFLARDGMINALQRETKCSLFKFNDTHTYAEVREVWLKAIEKAKEEECQN